MSLQELLDINKIVFGVDKVKITAYYCNKSSVVANSVTYISGLHCEYNFVNRFIYCGNEFFSFVFVLKILSGGSYSYVRFSLISFCYVNYDDVLNAAKSANYNNIDGISFICAIPVSYVPQSNNVNIKDDTDKLVYKMQLFTLNIQYSGGIRVYFLEYDQTKLLTF